MTEAPRRTCEHKLLAARNACWPYGFKVANTLWIVLDLRKKIIPVTLLAHKIKLKLGRLQKMNLLKHIKRKLAAHELRTCAELDEIPRPLWKMCRANGLYMVRLFDRMAMVDIKRMTRHITIKPLDRLLAAMLAFLEKVGGFISYKERFHLENPLTFQLRAERLSGLSKARERSLAPEKLKHLK